MSAVADVDLEPRALRFAFSHFPSGVTAICALGQEGPIGMTVSSFTSVSLAPPLVSVCIDHASSTWPRLSSRPHIGISVLGTGHVDAVRRLSSRIGDRFADVQWRATPDGAVLLDGAPLQLICRIHRTVLAGDHELVLFEVLKAAVDDSLDPLVFHRSTVWPWVPR